MKEKKVYKREYTEKGLNEYTKLTKYIKDNFHDDSRYLQSEAYERRFMGFEDNNLIIILPAPSSKKYTTKIPKHQASIIIEKVGTETNKDSKIETLLMQEGFKLEI